MKKSSRFFLSTLVVTLWLSLTLLVLPGEAQVHAFPLAPHTFAGSVTVGGQPAPSGLKIEARINNVHHGQSVQGGVATTDTTTDSNGTYGLETNFQVCGDDNETPETEGGVGGDAVEFFIQQIKAEARATDGSVVDPVLFQSGGGTLLDLSIPTLDEPTVAPDPSTSACATGQPEITPTPTPASLPDERYGVVVHDSLDAGAEYFLEQLGVGLVPEFLPRHDGRTDRL